MSLATLLRRFIANRRHTPRYQTLLRCEIIDPHTQTVLCLALAVDMSEGGLRLAIPAAVFDPALFSPAAQRQLLFRLALPDGTVTLVGRAVYQHNARVRAEAIERRPREQIIVGVQLEAEDTPDYEQFMALVRQIEPEGVVLKA